tara:strand:- start:10550 stop:11458 length:909 start_codon:yes stop_codon:yes gene_type:complete
MAKNKIFEVIIIGGSYAGLSAAMALGRSLRTVLIIDSESPCNKQTPHSHNFITQDGEKPSVIAKIAKEQVLKYSTVKLITTVAVTGKKNKNGFIITTQENEEFSAKKIIFATGIKDTMPNIKGFSDCWGISVVHCPYCHGYELRGQKTGIIGNGERAFHIASLVNNLTDTITILTSGKADFNEEQQLKLKKHNINIIEKEIAEVEHENGQVKKIIFNDASKIDFDVAYAVIPFTQHTDIPEILGCELTEHGFIKVNNFQETSITGVYACGDNTAMLRSVANAVYSGNFTGAIVNKVLTEENF